MKKLTLALCFMLSASGMVQAAGEATSQPAAGDAEAGKQKSQTCVACHGPDGHGIAPNFPNIAGQHPGYMVEQLQAFKSGKRNDPSMAPMAMPLSEQDMRDLAAYYSSQKPKMGTADETQVALGEKIYRGGNLETGVAACMACHSPTGNGNPAANYPLVHGQKPTYTLKQLQDFKAGKRSFNAGGVMMQDVASRMTEEEMKAVAQYIAGLYAEK